MPSTQCLLRAGRTPPAPAEQVDVRAHLREQLTGRVHAINPRDGVEDDLPPLGHLVIHAGSQRTVPEGITGRPPTPVFQGIRRLICIKPRKSHTWQRCWDTSWD